MSFRFAKAHGLGNDFILVEAELAPADPAPWARRLCDRHTGIGGDGVLLLEARDPERIGMRLFNADGSEAEVSGNGVRCAAAWGVRRGVAKPAHVVMTAVGPRSVEVQAAGASRYRVVADLGEPQLVGPLGETLQLDGQSVQVTATSLGNPHCAFFVEGAEDPPIFELGPALETHSRFVDRTNVEFVRVLSRGEIAVTFWERGVGYTRSSGTGSASAAAAAILHGRVDRHVRVLCDGGVLEVDWPEGGSLRQVGEVELLFEGEWFA